MSGRPNKVHWFHWWRDWGNDWSACVQIGPWWTFAISLSLRGPSFQISMGLISLSVGRYPGNEDVDWTDGEDSLAYVISDADAKFLRWEAGADSNMIYGSL